MASTYKTPGVYVEEVSLFPPSIAQVETAVPAFIGYTATHSRFGEDLLLKPTMIRSLAEYEESFGGAPPTEVTEVKLDGSNNVVETRLPNGFLLYDSLRLFFANGGSKCYIISVNAYPSNTSGMDAADFDKGLAALEKEDEPTLILFPDAVFLPSDKFTALQQSALAQAAKLGDRFAVLDTLPNEKVDGVVTKDFFDKVSEFRNAIGVNNLKYGACYGPYLRTNLDKKITYRHIKDVLTRSGAGVTLANLTVDEETKNSIGFLEKAISDYDELLELFDVGSDKDPGSLEEAYFDKENDLKNVLNDPTSDNNAMADAFIAYLTSAYAPIKDGIDVIAKNDGTPKDFTQDVLDGDGNKVRYLYDDVVDAVGKDPMGVFHSSVVVLFSHASHSDRVATTNAKKDAIIATVVAGDLSAPWGGVTADSADDTYVELTGDPAAKTAQIRENMTGAIPKIATAVKAILAEIDRIYDNAKGYEVTYENALVARFPLLKTIVDRTKNTITEMPPSGAVVGVYSAVDGQRGVHKAPANVSLSSVVGVTDVISHDEQQDLNVDVVAGKSVNAIRPFTGKGILIWGARTLAGNDNEWRYVSVRRFFNMVEESTKKATQQFVFEPNDANTWTKVKAMIENFLINQWRTGALAGSTPEQAFFVKVGLNQTMTAQDVLEGKMIIEIGMAAVRPAEFIILRFSHKMQEA